MKQAYHPNQNKRLDNAVYSTPFQAVHITVRSYNMSLPFIQSEIAEMVTATLLEYRKKLNVLLYAYCLMPNHIHILVAANEQGGNVLTFVNQFKGSSTNRSWKLGWQGKLW